MAQNGHLEAPKGGAGGWVSLLQQLLELGGKSLAATLFVGSNDVAVGIAEVDGRHRFHLELISHRNSEPPAERSHHAGRK